MFTQKTLAAAAAIALLPVGAFAGEFSATAGFEASVDFDSDFNQSGDAVEFSLGGEFEEGGFSAALGLTYDSSAAGSDEVETELSIAYGGDITEKAGYEVSLTSTWLNDSGYDTTEAELGLSYAFSDMAEGSYTYTYDLETEADEHEVAVEFTVGDWTIEPVLATDGTTDSYELNFGYEFDSGVTMGVEFSDDSAGNNLATSLIFGYEIDLLG
ncbi:MAG: hypothetical protein ACRBBS_07775 [Thalassovita sp.]